MPKPAWLKTSIPGGARYRSVRRAVSGSGLHTVCEEARCPNVGECWSSGTATFLILGETCTRGCRFCAVKRGQPGGATDDQEPHRVAVATAEMGLEYAVLTSVTRDDLPDGGAAIFAATVNEIHALAPPPLVEVLIPDYRGPDLEAVLAAGPDVLAHNLEVVERLTAPMRHRRFSFERSLGVLAEARQIAPGTLTKSSLMLGLGESGDEIRAAMGSLREVGVDILVLGQYLQPTRDHAAVVEDVHPDRFAELAEEARGQVFGHVSAGPLVRTSYRAAEAFVRHRRGAGHESAR
ncbi:MAG: lipoyl synthase [Deltaproteobacteria bacterium]|jgi:lipoic acid synthetase|nr:lipoyl synthase [Deltaproteobacteria bacterium]